MAIISESHISIHTYPEASHASVDIFTCSPQPDPTYKMLDFMKSKLKPKTMRIAEINRGNPLEITRTDWITGFSLIGCQVLYHVKKSLVSTRSKYQKIDVIENENFGRMLFLDNDLQIAENDADIYNHAVVDPIVNAGISMDNVAILGGGDGGILQEILKYGVKKAFLVDIDEEVIDFSKKYLKSICKNGYKDPRTAVVVDDANNFLDSNKGLDAIIYDLTWHPEAFVKVDRKVFLNAIFAKIRKSLKSDGMVTMQCGPEMDRETMKVVKSVLSKNFKDIQLQHVFIPSYCVDWIFASARPK